MIGSIKGTKDILTKYNLNAKKIFGQNFLIDENILNKIVKASEVTTNDGVIEIGPGIGALTEVLVQNAKKVLAYEIDKDMINVLNSELVCKYDNLKIINEDFLKRDFVKDLDYFSDCNKVVVVSNLPYYITTPILFKLLESNSNVKEFYLMVQKEVGLRLTSKPNTKDYNALSVLMEYKTNSKIEFQVSRNCFLPAPNVDSVIISVRVRKSEININNEGNFLKFIQALFNQRRKTIVNNLSSCYSISKDELTNLLVDLGYSSTVRSEQLSLLEIAKLYQTIFNSPK